MINILKDVCPCCLGTSGATIDKPKIYMNFKIGKSQRLYLCKEHFLELRKSFNDFYMANERDLINTIN